MAAAAAGVPAVAAMALEAALAGVLAAALQVRAARASASRVPAALLDQHLGRGLVPSCRGLRRRAPWAHGNDMRAKEMIPSRAFRPPRRGRPALLRHRVRRHPGRTAATAAAPGPPRRTRTPRRAPVQALAPDHRIDQSDLKSQLHLDRHGGHTPAGVMVRILQRILALTAAIWHNDHTAAPVHRSLTAYDH